MRIRASDVVLSGILVAVGAGTAEASVIASPTSPAGLLMTALLALALGWRLLSGSRQTR